MENFSYQRYRYKYSRDLKVFQFAGVSAVVQVIGFLNIRCIKTGKIEIKVFFFSNVHWNYIFQFKIEMASFLKKLDNNCSYEGWSKVRDFLSETQVFRWIKSFISEQSCVHFAFLDVCLSYDFMVGAKSFSAETIFQVWKQEIVAEC